MQYLRSSLRKNQMMHNTQRDGVSVTCRGFCYSLIKWLINISIIGVEMTSLETLVYLIKGRNYPVPSVLRESDTQEHQKHTQLLLVRHFVVFTTI